jgi:T5SS/PEP-CTERM-associated repeat protein
LASINSVRRTPAALAIAALLASIASTGASAAIVTSGAVTPDPTIGTVSGGLHIGRNATGSVTVNGGSVLTSDFLSFAAPPGSANIGDGTLVVTGAGSQMRVLQPSPFNLDIGGLGRGTLQLLDGGSLQYGDTGTACQSSCRITVSESAGSTGNLLVSGAGSSLNTVGQVWVGQALLFRPSSGDPFDYGSVGGVSNGTARVEGGASASSSVLSIGVRGGGLGRTDAELANGSVVVDGAGSVWTLTRPSVFTAAAALLQVAASSRATGSLTISNGGLVRLDGSADPTQASGLNMGTTQGTNASGSVGSITITGAGSALRFENTNGFANIGRGNGAQATLNVLAGGTMGGAGNGDLPFMQVGRGGGTGTANIDGSGSLVRLAGNDAFGNGAFLHVGRFDVTAGRGTLNITNGGRLEIDTSTTTTGLASAQPGFMIGRGPGSEGSATVSGAGSALVVSAGTPIAPYGAVGRDGATGHLTISAGGRVVIDGQHLSPVNNGVVYPPGAGSFFDIGRRVEGTTDGLASVGTVTVTGAGSEFVMSGPTDRIMQIGLVGTSANSNVSGLGTASGTLLISDGGRVTTTALLAGINTGGRGEVHLDGGHLRLEGQRDGGPAPVPNGAGLSLGRQGGSALMTMRNGSTLVIDTAVTGGGLSLGGSLTTQGGSGTLVVEGGSTITVNGPDASVSAGRSGGAAFQGSGTIVIRGSGSSLAVSGSNARVLIGRDINTVGNMVVGVGSMVSSSGLIGIAHNGTSNTAGQGTLVVDGTANAGRLIVGANGYLGGTGVINANVTNFGTINAGNSPGRLTINGDLDSSQGEIVLEVQDLGNGQWAYDEIVLGNPAALKVAGARIRFEFLGVSDPTAFENAGLFELDTFFKELDASGNVVDLDPDRSLLFDAAQWTANAAQYVISNFVFNPVRGASFTAVPVPAPATLALALAALVLLGWQRRARA